MPRIYTRTGDAGNTSLFGGGRVPKSDVRVDLYGEVDELNSQLGLAIALAEADADSAGERETVAPLLAELAGLQSRLLDVGAILADPERSARVADRQQDVSLLDPAPLEAAIDRLDETLPALRVFILPGGSRGGAALHVCRTICRRVERRAVAAAETIVVPASLLAWLNRLADYLFTAARRLNLVLGCPETEWRGGEAEGRE